MNLVYDSLVYVTNAPYFFISIGMTVSIAMFVGAIIFDGDLSIAAKGILSISLYAFFFLQITLTRILNMYDVLKLDEKRQIMGFASIVTLFILTLLWVIGILFGVSICRFVRRRYKKRGHL